jgi:hypothetical protein
MSSRARNTAAGVFCACLGLATPSIGTADQEVSPTVILGVNVKLSF